VDAHWRIELFGGLRVRPGSPTTGAEGGHREEGGHRGPPRPLTRFRTRKTALLLAYLAYLPGRDHSRDLLIDLFWPEALPEDGRRSLRQALSSLRAHLEPPGLPSGAVFLADRHTVRLRPEAVSTDVSAFEAALSAAKRAPEAIERAARLTEGVAQYRGALLAGYYHDWVLAEQERQAEAYFEALHALVLHLETVGDLREALQYARQGLCLDPLREEIQQDLIRLLAASGDPTAARRQYHEFERLLARELQAAPARATRALLAALEETPIALSSPQPVTPATVTRTFLLTDIEDSTRLWEQHGDAFKGALASHHSLLRREFRTHGGSEVGEAGDSFVVAFANAGDALAAAISAQRALAAHGWPAEMGPLKVRMALHTGEVEQRDAGYRGLPLHHASRILAAAHGGQILCSEVTAALLRGRAGSDPREIGLRDLGLYRLRGIRAPQRLLQVNDPSAVPQEFPAPNAEVDLTGELPVPSTRFFGRESEIARLCEMTAAPSPQARLVTLTGPGGTGKTRLALEVARRLPDAWRGAVRFVPLADIAEAGRIPDALRQALRLPAVPGVTPLDQVVATLSRQPTLLLLDNFEQLVEEGAAIVRALLERVSTLACLVTSRRLLELEGEREFPVRPLPVPRPTNDQRPTTNESPPALVVGRSSLVEAGVPSPENFMQCPSVQLFVDRAQAVRADFQVTVRNAAAVAALCERLEGIPLAIELAASRALVLTPAQMLTHLERRFDFLVSRRRDAAARHRTLRAAIEWSYRLLSPELQRFFAGLSVFQGGWTLEAAEAVLDEPSALECLEHLRACSLIQVEEADPDSEVPEVRFRMLEMLREFVREQLSAEERAELEFRHAKYYYGVTDQWDRGFCGPDARECLQRAQLDFENVRAALQCLEETGEPTLALGMAGALAQFCLIRGYLAEARQRLEQVLEMPGALTPTRPRANVLTWVGTLAANQEDFLVARSFLQQSLMVAEQLEDCSSVADSLSLLGVVAHSLGELPQARALQERALAIRRELGEFQGIAVSLWNLGKLALRQEELDTSQACYDESLTLFRMMGVGWGVAFALKDRAALESRRGDYGAARSSLEESLAICRQLDHAIGLGDALFDLGGVAHRQGDYPASRSFLEEALQISRRLGNRSRECGALSSLGGTCQEMGELSEARECFAQALAIEREQGQQEGILQSIQRLARLSELEGEPLRAVRLCGAAATAGEAAGVPIPAFAKADHDRAMGAARAVLGEEVFAAAWVEGQALTLEEAIAEAMAGHPTSQRSTVP
jgi:predicted ATPase/DNA-binding SARP family transcriptional activator